MTVGLQRLLGHMVPPVLRSAPVDTRRRAELATAVIWLSTLVSAIFAAGQMVFGSFEAGIALMPASVAGALLPLWVRRTGSLAIAAHGAGFICAAGICALAATTGGIFSPYLTALCGSPVMAVMIAGRRAGLIWLGVLLVAVWTFAGLHELALLSPPSVGSVTPLFVTLGVSSIAIGIGGSAIAHEALKGHAVRDLERSERERKETATEAMLLRADRLASVGMLATGVAHEINNPLTYVLTNVSAVQRMLARSDDPKLAEAASRLDMARAGAVRVRDIVRDLNTFSLAPDPSFEDVSLREVLDWSLRMASVHMRRKAKVETRLEAAPMVYANRGQLSQVVVNLLVNAAQAIDEGAAEDNRIEVSLGTDGRGWAVLGVRDTGSGIAPENLPRVTDPFFTTKTIGEGIGLGLTVSRNIVEQLGGTITFSSEVGRGTRVEVMFPPGKGDVASDMAQGSKR